MHNAHLELPDGCRVDYTIQTSARAKYVRMRLSAQRGLVVVKPAGSSLRQITEWVSSKVGWIAKHLSRMEISPPPEQSASHLPEQIALPAIGETWHIAYQPTAAAAVTLRSDGNGMLTLTGATHHPALCHTALQRWLQRHAKAHLGEWLQRLAADTGLRYTGCCVKGQRSRWGSCSSQGNINLNYKLMLLPPEWVRYVLIHELCHTVEMNHSKRFWAQVTRFEPGYKAIHAQMRGVMGRLPGWVSP